MIKVLGSPIWFAVTFAATTSGTTLDKLLFPRSSSFLHCMECGGLWFQLSHIFDL